MYNNYYQPNQPTYSTTPSRIGLKGRPVSSIDEARAITHAAMFSYEVKLTLEQEEFIADLIATHGQEIIDITNKIKGV